MTHWCEAAAKRSMQKGTGPLNNFRRYGRGRVRSAFSITYEIYGNERDF